LGFAWQKYKACQAAIKACNTLWNADSWGVFLTESLLSQILSVFSRGKTQWASDLHESFSQSLQHILLYGILAGGSRMTSYQMWEDMGCGQAKLWIFRSYAMARQ